MYRPAWLALVAGLWVLVSPFMDLTVGDYGWSNGVVGLMAAVTGAAIASTHRGGGTLIATAGIWLLMTAFLPRPLAGPWLHWNNVVGGMLVSLGSVRMVVNGTAPPRTPSCGDGHRE